jgi:hypothetical protein
LPPLRIAYFPSDLLTYYTNIFRHNFFSAFKLPATR